MMNITKGQKTIIATLSFGTFLEYFDLMLYVHTSVLLNDMFFPKTSSSSHFFSSIAFCSIFIFRPIGAFILGYIGDNRGRKTVIVLSTSLTAVSCIIIAILPTYNQIGITATIILTLCRFIQSIASVGESVGSEIYLAETIAPPMQYPAVALVTVFSSLGGIVALSIAYLIMSFNFNWRIAFWIGACVAIVGSMVRSNFKETSDFLNKKTHTNSVILENRNNRNKVTAIAFFFIQCAYPACFYFVYMYCADILKYSFGYGTKEVIFQNLIVSVIQIIGFIFFAIMSYKIYPLKIVKVRFYIFCIFIFILPYLLSNLQSGANVLLTQSLIVLFWLGDSPASSIFFKYFSTLKRFTYVSIIFSFSRALMYVGSSFTLVYLIDNFGYWILTIIMIPLAIAFAGSVYYFDKLEKQKNVMNNSLPA